MPGISRFFGIVIHMYANDHGPERHFHASYNGFYARFYFDGTMGDGEEFPSKQAKLVKKWALLRRAELDANWVEHVEPGTQPVDIPPLEHK